jgi:epsilon-lactone hydrolase
MATNTPFLHIPETVSQEAQAFLRTLGDPALTPPFPDPTDIDSWKKVQAFVEKDALAQAEPIVKCYAPTVTGRNVGGVAVLDVRPKGWKKNRKVVVYVHGGAHPLYSAKSTLGRAAIFAADTGHRVISVDYTLAPQAKFNQMSDEVVAVLRTLLKEGHSLADILIYGDSSGGGLAAAVVLKMRDKGLGMPVAAVLVSPWLDVTRSETQRSRSRTPNRITCTRNTRRMRLGRSRTQRIRSIPMHRPCMQTSPRASHPR